MNETYIKNVVEAALLAAGRPLQLTELAQLFDESARPEPVALRAALDSLESDYSSRGIEVKETATGFRIQVRRDLANEVSRLWPERPPRYSRALLETLALIAYRQPITRAEIEAVRGVAVNPNIIKTVLERNWVRVVGTRDVPGRPELLGTTKEFLDYFGLRTLEDLPPLAELKAVGEINLQLDLAKPNEPSGSETGEVAASEPAEAGGAPAADAAVAGVAVAVAGVVAAMADEAAASDEVAATAAEADMPGEAAESVAWEAVAAAETGEAQSDEAADDVGETVDEVAALAEALAAEVAEAAEEADESVEEVADPGEEAAGPTDEAVESADEFAEPIVAQAAVSHVETEADSGDVTVEIETLGLVEARIEAILEADEPAAPADTSIETGQFEMAELGVSAGPNLSVIEAEFEADDLDDAEPDEGDADDEEELSAGPQSSSELVAAPRGHDD